MEGWIKLYRSILKWEWYDDGNTFRVFLHLMLTANHDNKKWRGRLVKRGQVIVSVANLGKMLRLSPQSIRTSLSKLKSTGEITSKSTSRYTQITLCNYEQYQDIEIATNKQNNNQVNNRATNKQQTNNKQTTTNKNIKKERIKEGKKIDIDSFVPIEFKVFWSEWLLYRTQIRKRYKTSEGARIAFEDLFRLADGDPLKANEIIKQSIKHEWQGLFPLKEEQRNGKHLNGKQKTMLQKIYDENNPINSQP